MKPSPLPVAAALLASSVAHAGAPALSSATGAAAAAAADRATMRPARLGLSAGIEASSQRDLAPTIGLTYGLGRHLELSLSAVLARKMGGRAGFDLFLGSGAVRPVIEASVPFFLLDRFRWGAHLGAGLQWDLGPRLGVRAGAAYERFFSVPGADHDVGRLHALDADALVVGARVLWRF